MKKEREAKKLIKAGSLIAAIKLIRDANGVSLREAKDAVEGWAFPEPKAKARRC